MRARSAMIVLAALGLGACGGGSDTASSTPAEVRPADVASASRTVTIAATDDLRFRPAAVEVSKNQTVAFKVVNEGKADHEFVVGDRAFQADHENEMKDMPAGMQMGDEPTGIAVKAGETKTIALSFPSAGTVQYGCHEPGHYPAGMKGTITVT